MNNGEFMRGYVHFIRAAYKQSMARKAFAVVTWISEAAGVLALVGVTLVLTDLTTVPLWMPLAGVTAAALVVFLSVMHGAYVLWYNVTSELKDRDDAPPTVGGVNLTIGHNYMKNIHSGGAGIIIGRPHDFGPNPGAEPNGTSRPWDDR